MSEKKKDIQEKEKDQKEKTQKIWKKPYQYLHLRANNDKFTMSEPFSNTLVHSLLC